MFLFLVSCLFLWLFCDLVKVHSFSSSCSTSSLLCSPGGGQYVPRDPGDGWEEGRRGGLGEEVERLAGLLNMLLQQESAATR